MAPLVGGTVPVTCQHKADPPQFPGRTLNFSGGCRSIFGEPVPKGSHVRVVVGMTRQGDVEAE